MKNATFPKLNGKGLKIAIIHSRFNSDITQKLLNGCLAALKETGTLTPSPPYEGRVRGGSKKKSWSAENVTVVEVPGSFELPYMAAHLARKKKYDAIVCLGAIIKGETTHDFYIGLQVSIGLGEVARDHDVPVIFGVLTTKNKTQAQNRAAGKKNKGWEAGMSAVETALTKNNLQT